VNTNTNIAAAADTATPPGIVVRPSHVHGAGVFSTSGIQAGTRILEYRGRHITKAESARLESARKASGGGSVFLFALDDETDLDGDIPDNPARFINHSCDENCEVRLEAGLLWIYAVRDIAAGEELGFDYAFPLPSFFEHPCHCGAPGCPGYIVARHDRFKLRRLLARGRRKEAA
jgi:SET domain-containing protein